MKHSVAVVACGLALAVPLGDAPLAQGWPTRPITIVVPFPPGPLDVVSRLVGAKMSAGLGQPIVIDNRGGANGTIGSSLVARATPDGYTILSATIGTHVTAVHLIKNLPYDPVRDFTPIVASVEPVTCLVANNALPVSSVQELIELARRRPGELGYGTSGVGSIFHLLGELFNQTAGVKIQHVPYRGVGPAMQDVVGGHIPVVFTSVSTALPNLKDGRIRNPRRPRAYALFTDAEKSPPSPRCCLHSVSLLAGSVISGRPACRPTSSRVSIVRS